MRKVTILIGLILLAFSWSFIRKAVSHRHVQTQTPTQTELQYFPEADVPPPTTLRHQVSELRKINSQLIAASEPKAGPQQQQYQQRITSSGTLPSRQQSTISQPGLQPKPESAPQGTVAAHKAPYDPADLELLKRAAARARTEGSRVAYIGEPQELYAFSPYFFEIYTNDSGKKAVRVRQVASVQKTMAEQGGNQISVQREAYPVPSSTDAEIMKRTIMKSVDDGATLVNIASKKANRATLTEAIQYARSKGVAVVMVPPQKPY